VMRKGWAVSIWWRRPPHLQRQRRLCLPAKAIAKERWLWLSVLRELNQLNLPIQIVGRTSCFLMRDGRNRYWQLRCVSEVSISDARILCTPTGLRSPLVYRRRIFVLKMS
jgi:hypothetical protein